MSMAGLGIDFDPPRSPSPPLTAPNPLVTRLQQPGAGRRPLPKPLSVRKAVRIAASTPVVLGHADGEPVEEDYGEDLDSEELGGDEEDEELDESSPVDPAYEYFAHQLRYSRSIDGLQPRPAPAPLTALARSYSMAVPRTTEPAEVVRRPTLRQAQRPRSMFELSQLYARQSLEQPAASEADTSPTSLSSRITPGSQSSSSMAYTTSATSPESASSPMKPSDVLRARMSLISLRAEAARTEAAIHAAEAGDSSSMVADDGSVIDDATVAAEFGADGDAAARQGTLLSAGADPVRRQRELDRLLEPTLQTSASSSAAKRPTANASAPSAVVLEQGKDRRVSGSGKPRVELDVTLESELVVEGGLLSGKMEVRINPRSGAEVWIGRPKARVVGFEELAAQDVRHIFYHHASTVDGDDDDTLPCFDTPADDEGFHRGKPGAHTFPFQMALPIGKGAKGTVKCKQGVVRYIVIGSIKLKARNGEDRSIAHFYRHIDLYPYLSPALILAPAPQPIEAVAEKSMFMGGTGKVSLTAKLHRAVWVAGQRCYVSVAVRNDSSKKVRLTTLERADVAKIKGLALSLVRSTTVYRPKAPTQRLEPADPDAPIDELEAWSVQTTRKKMAECTLEMGKRGASGVTAKGMWLGVDQGEHVDFTHSIVVPPEALSVPRGRHLEITYTLKVAVSAGALTADLAVEMPVRIVNFVSLDPPPGHCGLTLPTEQRAAAASEDAPAAMRRSRPLDRMVSMDSLALSDLNRIYGQPGGYAPSTLTRTDTVSASSVARSASSASTATTADPRQLKHQMSLDCIGTAIASATSRRPAHMRSASQLREVVLATPSEDEEDEDDTAEITPAPRSVTLDEADSDEENDEVVALYSSQTAVVGDTRSTSSRPMTPVSVASPASSMRLVKSPVRAQVSTAAARAPSPSPRKSYGMATPTSPLKVSTTVKASPALKRNPTTLQRTSNTVRKSRSAGTLAPRKHSGSVSSASASPPDLDASTANSTPETDSSSAYTPPLEGAASTPPMIHDMLAELVASQGGGPKVVSRASPARKPTIVQRPVGPRTAAGATTALPMGVRSKIQALESRQEAIRVISKPRVRSVSSTALVGASPAPSSAMSQSSSVFMAGDRRHLAESISSFKAPLLAKTPTPILKHRREHSAII